ncbi:hypothetical protein [Microbulbifer zhoushanensis]|uniref:hypothetical protein n=1 Tax=Microbulbifer zhoushanensis TaxID=2904254 RepID=UPI001F3225E3|nr:hypothetical protein [Microbulbifer zhoushanensis]
MKTVSSIGKILLLLLTPLAVSAEPEEKQAVETFISEFMEDFSDSSLAPARVADEYFAGAPVFYVGEMPGLSDSPEISAVMLNVFREKFHVTSHPFTRHVIETLSVGDDGTAAILVAFRRPHETKPRVDDFCNIFSLAKLGGAWRITTWSLFALSGAPECSRRY